MAVHGRSFVQYLNEDDDNWYPLPVGDVIRLDYEDKVYSPASVDIVISNRGMNETLGTDIDASSGKYTVEGEVDNPTFRRYQTIRVFHLPRQLEPTEVTHNSASPAIFTKMAHGLNDGDYVQMVNEETGEINDDLYKVWGKSTNLFKLYATGTGSASQTYATAVAGDTVTKAMQLNEGLDDSETGIDVDNITGGGTDPSTQVFVGSYIQVGTEIMKVTGVSDTSLTVEREALGTTAAVHSDDADVNHARSMFMQMRTDKPMYCYFYGKIDSLDVSYSDAVGKTIHITASDYLLTLANTPVTKVAQESTSDCDDFTTTRLTSGELNPDSETAADIASDKLKKQGKFRNATYDNAKFSDTVKEVISDWSFGKTLYTDNTNNGSTDIGEAKFEDSSFSFVTGDVAARKSFGGTGILALQAATNIAMTDRHSNDGFDGTSGVTVTYTVAGSATASGSGADRDILINKTSHGYVNGNLVNVSDDNNPNDLVPDDIPAAAYIVHSVATNNFKIKNLNGSTIQSTAEAGSARTVAIKPEPSGAQGYDFNLDPGLYSTGTMDSAFSGNSTDTHRPHINYFMRGSRPIDPEATGLIAVYPTSENQAEADATFGLTKEFILPDFDHGIFDGDLYTQVALSSVDSKGQSTNANDLGHTLEMLKVNSISNEDNTYADSRTIYDYRKRGASGETHGKGVFHWNRADDARTYNWHTASTDTADELNALNQLFFATSTVGVGLHGADEFMSQGTVGVIEADKGGFIGENGDGMVGYSNLPMAGRPLTEPPDTPAKQVGRGSWRDAGKIQAMDAGLGIDKEPILVNPGGIALSGANLIKDIYHCEVEGLLGAEVTAAHDSTLGNITITEANHGLESGTIIKITHINGVTTGTTAGVNINASPDKPTTSNTTGASTRDTGSYYRVERYTWEKFFIQLPQLHHSDYRNLTGSGTPGALEGLISFSSSITAGVFKYKPVFNVFKEVCRVQWQSGYDWTTGEDLTVLRTSITGKGAQSLMISDVVKNDRPYRGIQVNALVAGYQESSLPGIDKTVSSLGHPRDFWLGTTDEQYSYFGYATVAFSLKKDFITDPGECSINVERLGENKDDDVPVLFKYGDYISETRFLYGDTSLVGVVGRNRIADGAQGAGNGNNGEGGDSSEDVFKNVNCKIIERFAEKRSISKTFPLQYNEQYQSSNSARFAAASILSRVLVPARRTTFNIFGYPTIKLVGQGQSSTTGNLLVPAANPVSFGGRAGMLVEKLDGADGAGGAMTASSLATAIASGGNITAPLDDGDTWDVGDYYRAFIYLRAGSSIRVSHSAAGITGNMIITGLKYSERGGTTRTTIATTGYDENFLNRAHPTLGRIRQTITASGSNVQPYLTARHVINLSSPDAMRAGS